MITYVNGRYLSASEAVVPLLDGGYLYGDGVFETLRIYGGLPFDLDGHLARMAEHLEALAFAWRPDAEVLRGIIAELVRRNAPPGGDARCRLTVSRGAATDELLPLDGLDALEPVVSVLLAPVGGTLAKGQAEGVAVAVMPLASARGDYPLLKTLNYLPAVVALRRAHAAGCAEALLVDADGRVLEAATSNVFHVKGRRLATPPTALGLLPGRTRALVCALAGAAGLEVVEEAATVPQLQAADEVFLSGSVKEILPVVAVDGRPVGDGRPGPATRALQNEYRRGVRDSLGDTGGSDPDRD